MKTRCLKGKRRTLKRRNFFDLKLDGIIADGKKAVAIINGGFYRKNERVNGFFDSCNRERRGFTPRKTAKGFLLA